jgi:hypothetical protein
MNSLSSPSKVPAIAGPRISAAGATTVPLRRFRIARLRLDARQLAGASRFDHLKRVYD